MRNSIKSKKGVGIFLSLFLIVIIIVTTLISQISTKAESSCDTSIERDTKISIKNNSYVIERNMIKNETPMGNKGVWTIFVYICGSDYESKNGAASKDIEEMIKASKSENIRVIVQTGGSKKWHNSNINANKIQRYIIKNGQMEFLQEKDLYDTDGNVKSMGNPNELFDFLSWGIDNYASEKMGLILWNHGGGSSDGICYDENANMESLKLGELELALCMTRKKMTSRFEFVGFDACVMQNIETANLMVPYAKYMVGSETAELEKGLDYSGFISLISKKADVSTLEVCKEICDSSYNDYLKTINGIISSGSVVFSVLDLDKVDGFLYEFNKVAKQINDMTMSDNYYKVLNKIQNSTRFGAGQIDIEDMLSNINEEIPYANIARSALGKLVVYVKKGSLVSWYKNPNGLSMFVSSEYAQIQNYNNLTNVAISPYMMNIYESTIYGDKYGDLNKYNQEKINWEISDKYYSPDFSFVNNIFENEKDFRESFCNIEGNDYLNKWFTILKKDIGINILDETSSIKCRTAINLDEDNHYNLQLDENSTSKIKNVKMKIFSKVYNELEGTNVYRELGTSNQVYFDKFTGLIREDYDSNWLLLPNGFPLQIMESYETDNYVRYISPCYINDDYVYLYSTLDLCNNSVEIEGYADTYDNNSIQTKILQDLKIGDCIQPMFMYTKELSNGSIAKDSEMNYAFCDVTEGFELKYSKLLDDDLYCSIILEDVFGNEIYTPISKYARGE